MTKKVENNHNNWVETKLLLYTYNVFHSIAINYHRKRVQPYFFRGPIGSEYSIMICHHRQSFFFQCNRRRQISQFFKRKSTVLLRRKNFRFNIRYTFEQNLEKHTRINVFTKSVFSTMVGELILEKIIF